MKMRFIVILLVVSTSAMAQIDLNDGLILYLNFDGNNADSTLNHVVSTNGAPTLTQDRNSNANSAYSFDGVDDSFFLGDPNAFDFGSNDFTVALWVKKLSSNQNYDNGLGIAKWNTGATPGANEWSLGIGGGNGPNSNTPSFNLEIGTTFYQVKPGANELTIGEWTHLVGIRHGGEIKFYFNGILTATTQVGTGAVNNAGRHLRIARGNSSNANLTSHAAFDDIAVYDRALSNIEVVLLYTGGVNCVSGCGTSTESYWKNDDSNNIFYEEGRVSIGIQYNNSDFNLAVKGNVLAEGVKVQAHPNWPDYVFSSNYKLRTLNELEQYVQANKHLPEIPSAKEIEEKGLDLGAMDAALLKKVEELTLYTIEQEKKITAQSEGLKLQSKENEDLRALIKSLSDRIKKLEKK